MQKNCDMNAVFAKWEAKACNMLGYRHSPIVLRAYANGLHMQGMAFHFAPLATRRPTRNVVQKQGLVVAPEPEKFMRSRMRHCRAHSVTGIHIEA